MKRIAVLRGGPSEEYDVSMRSGQAVLMALDELDYPHKDIIITKKGEWLDQGFVKKPEQALEAIDTVFLALHGTYGEDGQVQQFLDHKRIPYVGTKRLASSIAFNKDLTKQTLKRSGVRMPRHRVITASELPELAGEMAHISSEIGRELFIKPLASGSSVGARYIPHQKALHEGLTELLSLYNQVLIEEFIRGREATVGVLDNYRNQRTYVLPALEIVPPREDVFYNNINKYNGKTEQICPGRFLYGERTKLAEAAALVHEEIGCKQYSRSDFIVKDGEVYFLEVNTLPGFTPQSNFPKAAEAVGLSFPRLVQHLIDTVEH